VDRVEEITSKDDHALTLTSRRHLAISGVQQVDSFDDSHIALETDMGRLVLRGHNLKIHHLDLERGEFEAFGEIDALTYTQRAKTKGSFGSSWQKLWG